MKYTVKTKCPYCGHENITKLETDYAFPDKEIVTCDVEFGGCDRDYVIDPKINITVDVYGIIILP